MTYFRCSVWGAVCWSCWWGADCSCIRFILAGDFPKWEFGATNCVPETGHRQCHFNDFPEMRKLWKVWSKLPIRPVQAMIPPLRTNCWELIRERDLCFMNLLWWLDPQKAVVYNNIFLSAPDIYVLLVTLMITHRLLWSPDTELRTQTGDSGHRDWASLGGFCGCCRLPDGGISWWWSELFRCWLTLNSHLLSHCALTLVTVFAQCAYYLTVHWPDTILLLLGSHWLVTLVCISRLSASDWAEIVWRQRRGQGLVSARAGPATEGQHTGGE